MSTQHQWHASGAAPQRLRSRLWLENILRDLVHALWITQFHLLAFSPTRMFGEPRCPRPVLGTPPFIARLYRSLLALLSAALLLPGPSFAAKTEPAAFQYALQPGWNLLLLPESPIARDSLKIAQLGLWPVQSRTPDAPRYPILPSVAPAGFGYWVWSSKALALAWDDQTKTNLAATSTASKWRFFAVTRPIPYDTLNLHEALIWSAHNQRFQRMETDQGFVPGHGYWVRPVAPNTAESDQVAPPKRNGDDFDGPGPETRGPPNVVPTLPMRRTLAPAGLGATTSGSLVQLWWTEPTRFDDGTAIPPELNLSFRIFRDGEPVQDVHAAKHKEIVESRARPYKYQVSAVIENRAGPGLASIRSKPVHVAILEPSSSPTPGDFGAPAPLTDGRAPAGMPKTALSTHQGQTYAHLAFVLRGAKAVKSEVRYTQSAKAGLSKSFRPPLLISTQAENRQVSFLALTADAHRVSIAWVEESPRSQEGTSEVYVAQSQDGGQSFGHPQRVRSNTAWKRGLDIGYDHFGHHHLVWGEAHKVYYLKNLEGMPSSVFDVRKREAASEIIHYKAYYGPPEITPCACEDCWCEESYLLRDPPSQHAHVTAAVSSAPLEQVKDAYVERTEESDMHEPSLHIDGDKLSIVARQSRVWDSKPVLNPAWVDMLQDPIYSDVVVQRQQPTRLVVGWRSVWKTAYAKGDRDQLSSIDYQHQYLYSGSWHYEPQIKLAQRPLTPEAWANMGEGGFSQGRWAGQTMTEWRISTVASGATATEWQHKPAHPQLYTSPEGILTAVFERGRSVSSDAEQANPSATLEVVFSKDGGLTWSASEPVGVGYTPQLAISALDETGVLFYAPESAASRGTIRWVHKQGAQGFSAAATLSRALVLPIRRGPQGEEPDVAFSRPSLSAHAELFFAAWVRKGMDGLSHDQIFTARAARVSSFSHLEVEVKEEVAAGLSIPVTVRTVNKYFVPVRTGGTVEVLPPASPPPAVDGLQRVSSSATKAPLDLRFELQSGVGQVTLPIVAQPGGLALSDGTLSVRFTNPEAGIEATSLKRVTQKSGGNYAKAIDARDRLLRHPPDTEEPAEFYYQVEYLPSVPQDASGAQTRTTEPSKRPDAQDAQHLAGFERVWTYTQGITLAQLATAPSGYGPKARGLARFLCQHAVKKPNSEVIMGWPFSWNTRDDNWADARLVTGANAWAIHGLGVFLTSEAYRQAAPEDQKMFRACYQNSLDGLHEHRRRLLINESRMGSLMSAGWTTRGLQGAHAPHRLRGQDAGYLFTDIDSNHRFSYYSVLDAIGYKTFSPTQIRVCGLGPGCDGLHVHGPTWQRRAIDQKAEWAVLKTRVPAENVVTEHSLDVLHVLNYALNHSDSLGPKDPESRRAWTHKLGTWRDELRDGVFFLLWDDHGWRDEFAETLAHLRNEVSTVPLTEAQATQRALRVQAMQEALDADSLGRVITGGILHLDGSTGYRFEASSHTAIDNCSWLALSVQDDLDGLYAARLSRCLGYTVIQFAKDLSAGDEDCDPAKVQCPPQRTYRGAHYFQNAFKDPYIAPSALQESSYHLEATMGLILGLLKFARAHPGDSRAPTLVEEAHQLWAGAQSFVGDRGFIYSSQRIPDLSARLVSSTALVWFIDVYNYFAKNAGSVPAPLAPEHQVGNGALALAPGIRSKCLLGDGPLSDACPHAALDDSLVLTSGTEDTMTADMEDPAPKTWLSWLGPKDQFQTPNIREANAAGAKQVFKKPGRSLYGAFRELLAAEPHLAAAALPVLLPGAALAGDLNAGLTTMVAFNETPGSAWTPVGSIRADELIKEVTFGEVHSGLGLYYEDESVIRAHRTYQSPDGSSRIFGANKIYGFDTSHLQDLIPLAPNAPGTRMIGDFLAESPQIIGQDGRIDVFVLDTEASREAIVDTFLRHHLWWQSFLEIAAHLPDGAFRENLLRAVRGFLLGWFFDAAAVERSAGIVPQPGWNLGTPSWWTDTPAYANLEDRLRDTTMRSTAKDLPPPDEQQNGDTTPNAESKVGGKNDAPHPQSMATNSVPSHLAKLFPVDNKAGIYVGFHEDGHLESELLQFSVYAKIFGALARVDASKLHPLYVSDPLVFQEAIEERRTYNTDLSGKPVYLLNFSDSFPKIVKASDAPSTRVEAFIKAGIHPDNLRSEPGTLVDNTIETAHALGISVVAAAGDESAIISEDQTPASLTRNNLSKAAALESFSSNAASPLGPLSSYGPKADVAVPGIGISELQHKDGKRRSLHKSAHTALASFVLSALKGIVILEFTEHGHEIAPDALKRIIVGTRIPSVQVPGVEGIFNPRKALAVAREARKRMDAGTPNASLALDELDVDRIPPLKRTGTRVVDTVKVTTVERTENGNEVFLVSKSLDDLKTMDWSRYLDIILMRKGLPVDIISGEEMAEYAARGELHVTTKGHLRWKEALVRFTAPRSALAIEVGDYDPKTGKFALRAKESLAEGETLYWMVSHDPSLLKFNLRDRTSYVRHWLEHGDQIYVPDPQNRQRGALDFDQAWALNPHSWRRGLEASSEAQEDPDLPPEPAGGATFETNPERFHLRSSRPRIIPGLPLYFMAYTATGEPNLDSDERLKGFKAPDIPFDTLSEPSDVIGPIASPTTDVKFDATLNASFLSYRIELPQRPGAEFFGAVKLFIFKLKKIGRESPRDHFEAVSLQHDFRRPLVAEDIIDLSGIGKTSRRDKTAAEFLADLQDGESLFISAEIQYYATTQQPVHPLITQAQPLDVEPP